MVFEPFVGIGPKRFYDMFSMKLSDAYDLKRKDSEGNKIDWNNANSKLRLLMKPSNYIKLEFRLPKSLMTCANRREKKMTNEEFREKMQQARERVDASPGWEKAILKESFKSKNESPREPIVQTPMQPPQSE